MLSPLRKRAGSRLREPFGKAGLTVAVIALVFAMLGGAYAATGLNSKQKKEVKSIAKSFQGTGPAGAQGPAGSNGSNGAKGDAGPQGKEGPQGKDGKQGKEGSPWTAGGVLPKGKTETGTWGLGLAPTEEFPLLSITYNIPVAEGDTFSIHYLKQGEGETTECPGTVAEPEAAQGNLCVYTEANEAETNPIFYEAAEATETYVSGAILVFQVKTYESASGTWAVTAVK